MDHRLDRIEELINEIKVIREVNNTLHRQVSTLQQQLYDKEYEIKTMNSTIEKLKTRLGLADQEKQAIQKKMDNKTRALENEIRKNGIFNQKVMATSKTKKEHLMIQEMDSLRKVNRTVLGFVDVLGKEFEFDIDILKALVSIADNVDDRILQLFIDGIKDRIKSKDIEMKAVEINDK
jgi:chromosome segregation ATPase